jgi:hypothetical protein
MKNLKKGELVKVWSLQSFFGGGFLNGETAEVRQDQNGDSVILRVKRKGNDGEYFIDESYEVYRRQCKRIKK